MPPERRRLVLLLALLAVVSAAAAYQFWPSTPTTAVVRRAGRPGAAPAQGPTSVTAPDVHLQALRDDRPQPVGDPRRDLFRFKPKAPPPRPVVTRPPAAAAPVVVAPPVPSGPPPLPPIAMRFIGVVEEQEQAQKIAILTDGRGTYQGREGDIIEGRFRIVRIGVESVEMSYLDGRGRQTIRLSGS